ncbi:MAG: radical SAM family heme chaperone HemW [Candidatus Eiseniibacteriota bacterium]
MAYGVYIHTPFCASKCPYCDFYSGVFDPARMAPLVDAILREAALRWSALPIAPVSSLYVGGGTPSLLPPPLLERLLGGLRETLPLDGDAEITVEANPESLDPATAETLLTAGVGRLSVGLQALDDTLLACLGRAHDAARALEAARLARRCFRAVSFDLLLGVPGLDLTTLEHTLQALLALEPDHLSVYDLTDEPGTPFTAARARGELPVVPDAACLAQDALVERLLGAAGFERYEVSNYARPGGACRHNLAIWRGGWYLGLGPAAHSKLPLGESPYGLRQANVRDLDAYLAAVAGGGDAVASREVIDRRQAIEERLLLGLRLAEGIDLDRVARDCGLADAAALLDPAVVASLGAGGFIERRGSWLRVTPRGRQVLDEIVTRLAVAIALPAAAPAVAPAPAPEPGPAADAPTPTPAPGPAAEDHHEASGWRAR